MAGYIVSKREDNNGEHIVHRLGCSLIPSTDNRIYLGDHSNCATAVEQAKKHYPLVQGCYSCAKSCHNT